MLGSNGANRFVLAFLLRHHFAGHLAGTAQEEHMMERILVVDDEQAVRDTVQLLLKREGYRVATAESGSVALEMMEIFDFDMAIVDVVMPGMDGFETITAVRKKLPGAPIIVISAHGALTSAETDYFRAAMELGATCCLQKPFSREQLLDAIAFCRAGKGNSLVA
jgi:CheY-like chemotaxis protein